MKKKLFRILIPLAVVGAIIGGICWFAPQSAVGKVIVGFMMSFGPKHRDANDEKGIAIAAAALAKEYAADEKTCDAKYLNKAIEVTGTVGETEKNQEGGLMVVLSTDDPMACVQCSMHDKNVTVNKGQNLTIKGFCSGSGITGVTITDCVVK